MELELLDEARWMQSSVDAVFAREDVSATEKLVLTILACGFPRSDLSRLSGLSSRGVGMIVARLRARGILAPSSRVIRPVSFELETRVRCSYCDRTEAETGAPLEQDHIIPRSKGGRSTVPACRPCNASKGDLVFDSLEDARRYLRGGG